MVSYDWDTLLKELSRKLIQAHDEHDDWELTLEIINSQWLGKPGASEEEILETETRLAIQLPPSYREFLKVSNGWPHSDWTALQLWPIQSVEWFSTKNQDWISAYITPIFSTEGNTVPDEQYFVYDKTQDCCNCRFEYLQTALEISSDSGDGDIFLLIPEVVSEDGEWEAWHFGNKLPGANRYRSFYDLMLKVVNQGRFIL